MEKNKIRRR